MAFSLKQSKALVIPGKKLNQEEFSRVTILGYGVPGAGKSLAIFGLLKAGLKVAVLSTEAGGTGLRSVMSAAEAADRAELLNNLVYYDLPSFEYLDSILGDRKDTSYSAFWGLPAENKTLLEFNPDIIVWDGFSNFQVNYIDEYVLSLDYAANIEKLAMSEMRNEGLIAGEKDWDAIGRLTKRYLDRFVNISRPDGTKPHVYVNCWEKEPDLDNPGRKVKEADKQYRPFLVGSARQQILGYFDFAIRMVRIESKFGADKSEFKYYTAVANSAGRVRGNELEAVENADMEEVWKKLNKNKSA